MKVLLQLKVPHLGNAGEIKNVSDGYARNFLIPKKLAVVATPEVLSEQQRTHDLNLRHLEKEIASAKSIAGTLKNLQCVLKRKANKDGHLYAGVHPRDIALELQQSGIHIEESSILISGHIKSLGAYTATITLPHGIEVTLPIEIAAIQS